MNLIRTKSGAPALLLGHSQCSEALAMFVIVPTLRYYCVKPCYSV